MANNELHLPLSTIAIVLLDASLLWAWGSAMVLLPLCPPFNCCSSAIHPSIPLIPWQSSLELGRHAALRRAASVFIFVGWGKAAGLSFF